MADCLAEVDVFAVEFNHDVSMQKSSGRPAVLIERNLSDLGHLSNRQGGELLHAVLSRCCDRTLRHVVLLHLSEQCNLPDLAVQAAENAIRAVGRSAVVHAARQSPAFPNLSIEPDRRPVPRTLPKTEGPRPARARKQPVENRGSQGASGLFLWDSDPE
jgi:hypothetical protein